jgi:hypothetical protein
LGIAASELHVANFVELRQREVRAPLVTMPQACPIGRLPLMTEEGRPTGLQYEDVVKAATSSGTVEFEGRQVRVVGLQERSGLFELPSQRITLDLGEEYLALTCYLNDDDEFMEMSRDHPFEDAR